jgi:hypothetical protein
MVRGDELSPRENGGSCDIVVVLGSSIVQHDRIVCLFCMVEVLSARLPLNVRLTEASP